MRMKSNDVISRESQKSREPRIHFFFRRQKLSLTLPCRNRGVRCVTPSSSLSVTSPPVVTSSVTSPLSSGTMVLSESINCLFCGGISRSGTWSADEALLMEILREKQWFARNYWIFCAKNNDLREIIGNPARKTMICAKLLDILREITGYPAGKIMVCAKLLHILREKQ